MLKFQRSALCLFTAFIAIFCYWDPRALKGGFIYDDVASIVNNEVVLAKVPWQEAFRRDFWGTPMKQPQSHKSYRPITTLTLRMNMVWSYIIGTAGTEDHTCYFHIFNVLLHGCNTGMITEVAAIVLGDENAGAALIAGLLFGVHPVHAEAVSNITSRGELLMTLFNLLAFLSYASHIPARPGSSNEDDNADSQENTETLSSQEKNKKRGPRGDQHAQMAKEEQNATSSICFLYIIPFICTTLSLFSKEQGVTTLCTLAAFDFLRNYSSIQSFLRILRQNNIHARQFLVRMTVLAIETLVMAGWRYYLNGETQPQFVEEQNPQGFAQDRFTRVFSINWIYVLYIRDMILPIYLAPDWSGIGIPLVESMQDQRAWMVCGLWTLTVCCLYSLYREPSANLSHIQKEVRTSTLIAVIAFLFLPFLLSSNLLVTTGLTKADRVIYLPLFGYCLLQGLFYKLSSGYRGCGERLILVGIWAFFTVQLYVFGLKTHERNLAWADEYTLWTHAFQVNPRSFHTRSNAGRLLAKNNEFVEAENVLRPIKDVRSNGGNPNDTFLYAVALSKLDRCEEAFHLIDDATDFLLEEQERGGLRYNPKMSLHAQSSLVVARAFCTANVIEKGKLMQQSLELDPTNAFAQSHYIIYIENLQRLYQQMKQMGNQVTAEIQMEISAIEQQLWSMEQQIQYMKMQQENPAASQEEVHKLQQQSIMEQQQQMTVMQQRQQNQQLGHSEPPNNEEQMHKMMQQQMMMKQQQQQQQQISRLPPMEEL